MREAGKGLSEREAFEITVKLFQEMKADFEKVIAQRDELVKLVRDFRGEIDTNFIGSDCNDADSLTEAALKKLVKRADKLLAQVRK